MDRSMRKVLLKFIYIFLFYFTTSAFAQNSGMWVTAYYAGWIQGQFDNGHLPSKDVDFSAVTQIIHFALEPRSNGTLDSTSNSILPINSSNLISQAHAAGVKVIISIGGWSTQSGFRGATNSSNLDEFVPNLIRFMRVRGYDGIDIDWEPLSKSDGTLYTNFIKALRSELDKITPRPLLTAATSWQPSLFASLADQFDEINLMTYDLSGAWEGWVTWHNSPVYDDGIRFGSTDELVPSCDGMVAEYMSAGVPKNKLGIGIDFYGYVWSGGSGTPTGGATAPNQSWSSAPDVTANVPYYEIMQNYYQPSYYRWDSGAQAAYLSIDNSGSSNDKFISYDDEASCASKVKYVMNNNLGGVFIWELGGGYRNNAEAGQQDVLLQAVKSAAGGIINVTDLVPPTVALTTPSDNSIIRGNINLEAAASDNIGVSSVVFEVDGSQIGNAITSEPFEILWNTSSVIDGNHTITAIASDAAGNSSIASVTVEVSNVDTNVSGNIIPTSFALKQNYPNPFNLSTTIDFDLPVSSHVTLQIFDVLGEEVAELIDENLDAGTFRVQWNATGFSSGIYIYRLIADNKTFERKMNLLK